MKLNIRLNKEGYKIFFFLILLTHMSLSAIATSARTSFNDAGAMIADEEVVDLHSDLLSYGKEWTLAHIQMNPSIKNGAVEQIYTLDYVLNAKVVGTEIVDSKVCAAIELQLTHFTDCSWCKIHRLEPKTVYAYEEDGRLFIYRSGYSSEANDWLGISEEVAPHFQEMINLNNSESANPYGTWNTLNDEPLTWIDGVGVNYGFGNLTLYPENIIPTGMTQPYYMLVNCKENGTTIYDNSKVLEQNGIDTDFTTGINTLPTADEYQDAENSLYTLQGIKVNNPIKGHIYVKKGKTIIF
ncbi:MAG: hypothetical protein K2M88_02360 [Muribaculaceae bacterium]|nr:hypothetical protein [Muribaculaceae bacterium]